MNIIITGFHCRPYIPIITKILSELHVQKAHIIMDKLQPKIPKGTKPIFYKDMELNTYIRYPLKFHEMIPIDEELIENLAECESIVLRMMDRLLTEENYISFEFRKRAYLKHLRYWNHILTTDNIDYVICSFIPHQIYDYILFHLCKLKKIPIIVLTQVQIEDTVISFEDFEEINYSLKEKYQKALVEYTDQNIEKIILPQKYQKFFNEKLKEEKNPTPLYSIPSSKKKKSILSQIKPIIGFMKLYFMNVSKIFIDLKKILFTPIIKKIIQRFVRKKLTDLYERKLFYYYEKNCKNPDLNQKYILIAFHYQPEVTTSPMGGAYVDQFLIVQMLAYLAPEDVLIYVKDHPVQKALGRDMDYYKELLEIPNVRLISRNFSTYKLIDNSIAVVTVTGSIGIEALFREKPVMIFGHVFYQYIPGVFMIRTVEDCKNALHSIIHQNIKPKISHIKLFFHILDQNSLIGHVDFSFRKISKITDLQNYKNETNYLIEKIKALKP